MIETTADSVFHLSQRQLLITDHKHSVDALSNFNMLTKSKTKGNNQMSEEPGIYNVPQTKDQIRRNTFTQIGQIERSLKSLQITMDEVSPVNICSNKNKQLFSQINHQLGLLPKSFTIDYENK